MLIPLYDHNPTDRQPVVTYTIIALNVLSWLAIQGAGSSAMLTNSICYFGLVPADLVGLTQPGMGIRLSEDFVCRFDATPNYATLVTSMFMHGGWLHLIGNMWFLWIFGDNIENALGRIRFCLFYLICGLAAAGAQILSNPFEYAPMVGASGAISGVLGAYLFLHPRTRVKSLLFIGIFFWVMEVPAMVILGVYFVSQLLSVFSIFGSVNPNVAFLAHIGGFLAGFPLVYLMRKKQTKFVLKPRN